METSTALTASNARSLRSTNVYIPLDFIELEDGLGSFLALLGAVMGTTHPLIPAYQANLWTYCSICSTRPSPSDWATAWVPPRSCTTSIQRFATGYWLNGLYT